MSIINKIGRRKNSIARVYLQSGKGEILINGKDYKEFFPTLGTQYMVMQPFLITQTEGKYDVKVNVAGGGTTGQAQSIRMAIARALVEENEEEYKPSLKREKLLTRDSRMVERKKFGQKKARKKSQFSKR
ncbi:MAG: 30S ribosomal protein S9 [Bacteroidetes bacterium MED-G17]|jgi:small subunit ribosomal protein S9|nr:MAG: 30S ribosomal protein S9 [Bacteroidetes bacterium MED-G17]CAI8278089.1 MAG: 30S ribosomal protein S9 [Bacteroidetes bacterium MED-G17]|tara:strand:+ start:435 stop:824 length:390 start_codon:yes stop_codon:yes gene_type:complete